MSTENREVEKPKKKKKPKKGIETMFKMAANSNQRREKIADYKARNMITVNSIILSAAILLLRQEIGNSYSSIPAFMLLTVSVLTLIFAILATRPKLKTKEEGIKVKGESGENIYFGDFYELNQEEYRKNVWEVMEDYDYLYNTLIDNTYRQGVLLAKRFKMLRISYNIFMYGLIVSVLTFMIVTML